jgi:hypothetical protein
MGNRRDREEKIMKKLAIIGTVFASVLLWSATAQAKPTGMSQAEYRALNQKYGVQPQQAALRVRLEEIGAWAVPSTSKQMPLAHQPGQPTVREQLREIGAWAVPSTSKTTVVASSSGEFDWNNAGIGAALVLGVAVFGAATLLAVRRHHHRPVAY